MPNKQHHVQPHGDDWEVKKNGADRASVVTSTKKESEKAVREISKNQGTELVIHKNEGTI